MALFLVQGDSGSLYEADGTIYRAQRITPRPLDYEALGHYTTGLTTGILPAGLAANSEIFQFRWSPASNLAVIRKIRISAAVTTTFFAAGIPLQIDLVKATAWTVAGTGGATPTIAATLKKRTSMGSSTIVNGDVRIATTAALGAGTKTLEANSMQNIVAAGPITASLNGMIIAPGTIFWQAEVGDGECPLILTTNEGFVIRSVAVPGTGTWQASFQVDWAEVAAY